MAIDILSIAPQSAEPERSFSGARRTVSWDRGQLKVKTIQKVECVGNWLRNGLIIPYSHADVGLIIDVDVFMDEQDDPDSSDSLDN